MQATTRHSTDGTGAPPSRCRRLTILITQRTLVVMSCLPDTWALNAVAVVFGDLDEEDPAAAR